MPLDALEKLRKKYPEYADIPDQELASRIVQKYPEYEDLLGDVARGTAAPAGPNAITRGYQAIAKPVTDAVSWGLTQAQRWDPLSVAHWAAGVQDQVTDEMRQQAGQTVAGIVVPQTPTQAAIMAATGGAGALARGAPPVIQAIARTAGAAGGGATGAMLEGHDPLEAGATAGGITAGLEALYPVLGKLIRSLPGMKARIANDDANNYLAQLEQQGGISGYTGQGSAGAQRVAGGPGLAQLGENKETAVRALEQVAPQIPMPSLGGATVSIRQANDELSRVGDMMRGIRPLDPRFKDADLKQLYGTIAREIRDGIEQVAGPQAAAFWDQTQGTYRAGRALLKPLTKSSAFRTGEELQFNTPAIQRLLANPESERMLRQKLGDEGFEALRSVMLRGGKPGEVDILTGGAGNTLSALQQVLRGTNTGASQYVRVPITTALPNLGSAYAGQAPYTMPQNMRTLFDMLLSATGAAGIKDPASQ